MDKREYICRNYVELLLMLIFYYGTDIDICHTQWSCIQIPDIRKMHLYAIHHDGPLSLENTMSYRKLEMF